MRLGYSVGVVGGALSPEDQADLVSQAEQVGYESAWCSEIFGTNPVGVLGWLAAGTNEIGLGSAVLQLSSRTAVSTACSAATLQRLCGGRLKLGIGVSGPQVVEGWHGVPYQRPLAQLRDYVAILRLAMAGKPVSYSGVAISVPLPGGQGRPAPIIGMERLKPIPLYLAGIGQRAVALAGEIADGWLAIHCPPRYVRQAVDWLATGAATAGRSLEGFDVAVMVHVLIEEDIELARDMTRPSLAMYLGAMGTQKINFYNRLARQLGYGQVASQVQDAYMSGDIDGAISALSDDLVDEMTICGPADLVRRRLAAYRDAGTTTLIAGFVPRMMQARSDQIKQLADLAQGMRDEP